MLARSEATGAFAWQKVVRHYFSHYDETVTVRVRRTGGSASETILSSRIHPFMVRGKGWVRADELEAGDEILTGISDETLARPLAVSEGTATPAPYREGTATVEAATIDDQPLRAHNLEVDEDHTFFVGETALWVHNGECGDGIEAAIDANKGKEGVYGFDTPDGRYTGQSGDMGKRLGQHFAKGKLKAEAAESIATNPVDGGKLAREIAEHREIQRLTEGVPARKSPKVANKKDPIGEKRKGLLDKVDSKDGGPADSDADPK